jgi:hypothetical protein
MCHIIFIFIINIAVFSELSKLLQLGSLEKFVFIGKKMFHIHNNFYH